VATMPVISTSIAAENAMLDGGWSIPFLVATPLGAVAIWFRLKTPETPSFEANEDAGLITKDKDDQYARHGLLGVVRHFWKEILLAIAIVAASQTVGYALTSFMPTYLEETSRSRTSRPP